jgi:hypothetical protein
MQFAWLMMIPKERQDDDMLSYKQVADQPHLMA